MKGSGHPLDGLSCPCSPLQASFPPSLVRARNAPRTYESGSRIPTPPPNGMVPHPPPIPHTFCARHCNETYISIFLHARRCSETHIFILLDEPSRRIRWVDRAKLWRNANFKLQELLRAVYGTFQCSANGIIYIYTYTGTYPYTYIYIKIDNYIIKGSLDEKLPSYEVLKMLKE